MERPSLRRFDVAQLLESAMTISEWKGDYNNFGVFFTHDKSYCLNKILAIRLISEERAPDVFYSFWHTSIEEKVTVDYPYNEMEYQPKKHHLLTEQKRIKQEELDSLFNGEWSEPYVIELDEIVEGILKEIPKKRERERTQVCIALNQKQLSVELCKGKKEKRKCFLKRVYPIQNEIAEIKNKDVVVGTSAFVAVMSVFGNKTEVSFQFSHDKIKITGEHIKDERHTEVEVVLAQMK